MNIKTEYQNETISEGTDNYGVGGAFPPIAPIIENAAAADLASFLFPEIEDNDQAQTEHSVAAQCPKARSLALRGEQIGDGSYPVTVLVDGVPHEVTVTISW